MSYTPPGVYIQSSEISPALVSKDSRRDYHHNSRQFVYKIPAPRKWQYTYLERRVLKMISYHLSKAMDKIINRPINIKNIFVEDYAAGTTYLQEVMVQAQTVLNALERAKVLDQSYVTFCETLEGVSLEVEFRLLTRFSTSAIPIRIIP